MSERGDQQSGENRLTPWRNDPVSNQDIIDRGEEFLARDPSAADAAKKAFVVNRIGDFGFALGVMLLFLKSGSIFTAR